MMSQEEATHWREKLNMLPDRVVRALQEKAPLLPPPPDPANIHAIMWTVIAAEAALQESKPMKKVDVVESKTYNVTLTPEEARAIIILDSYTIYGPLRELADTLTDHEGEPDGGELSFDVYDDNYNEMLVPDAQGVVIAFNDGWGG